MLPDAFDMFQRVLPTPASGSRSRVRTHLLEDIGVNNVLWETDFPAQHGAPSATRSSGLQRT